MRFIGQIALDPEIFGHIAGQMAYLFLTDDEEIFVDNTFDPEGGENAVIIQPGTSEIPTQPLATGPTLYKMVNAPSGVTLMPVSCEFTGEVSPGEDPDVIVEDEQAHATDEAWEAFTALWEEIKIGGTPAFVQGPEFPEGTSGQLLLQLDSANLPFSINFGDAGVGYAFLSADGTRGKFLWQGL